MDIPGSPPSLPGKNPVSGLPGDSGKQEESTGTGRKIKTVKTEKNISEAKPSSNENSPLSKRKVNLANTESMPLVRSESANMLDKEEAGNVSEGTIFIESEGNPEQALKKTVGEIKKSHGSELASKAKAFFSLALDFCKAHKNEILGVAGFALITAGVAGGIACPVVFILVAPGIIAMGCGMGGLLGKDEPLPSPSPGPEPKPSPDPEPTPSPSPGPEPKESKKEANKSEEETSSPVPEDQEGEGLQNGGGSKLTIPEPPPLQNLNAKKTKNKDVSELTKKLENQVEKNIKMPVASAFLPDSGMGQDLRAARASLSKKLQSSMLDRMKGDDLSSPDVEKALKNVDPGMHNRIYTEYSRVMLGFRFFKDSHLNDKKGKYQEARKIRSEEMDILMRVLQKKALEQAIVSAKEKKDINAHDMALSASKEISRLTGDLTMPASLNTASGKEKNQAFCNGVNEFFADFAESVKSSRSVNKSDKK